MPVNHAPPQPNPRDQHQRDAGPQDYRRQYEAVAETQPREVQRFQQGVVQPGAACAEAARSDQQCAETPEQGGPAVTRGDEVVQPGNVRGHAFHADRLEANLASSRRPTLACSAIGAALSTSTARRVRVSMRLSTADSAPTVVITSHSSRTRSPDSSVPMDVRNRSAAAGSLRSARSTASANRSG